MKCLYCNGTGDITKNNKKFRQTSRIKLLCPHCRGTGVEPLTNDEWRKTCSAEEFAKFLTDILQDTVTYTGGINFTTKVDDIKYWIGWLKEKHDA